MPRTKGRTIRLKKWTGRETPSKGSKARSSSNSNPASRRMDGVSRFGWQPHPIFDQSGCSRSCASPPVPICTDMLHEEEPSFRSKHPSDLPGRRQRVLHRAEHQRCYHKVDTCFSERNSFGLRGQHPGNILSFSEGLELGTKLPPHFPIRLRDQQPDIRRIESEVCTGSRPDLQDPARHARQKSSAYGRQSPAFDRGHETIVVVSKEGSPAESHGFQRERAVN